MSRKDRWIIIRGEYISNNGHEVIKRMPRLIQSADVDVQRNPTTIKLANNIRLTAPKVEIIVDPANIVTLIPTPTPPTPIRSKPQPRIEQPQLEVAIEEVALETSPLGQVSDQAPIAMSTPVGQPKIPEPQIAIQEQAEEETEAKLQPKAEKIEAKRGAYRATVRLSVYKGKTPKVVEDLGFLNLPLRFLITSSRSDKVSIMVEYDELAELENFVATVAKINGVKKASSPQLTEKPLLRKPTAQPTEEVESTVETPEEENEVTNEAPASEENVELAETPESGEMTKPIETALPEKIAETKSAEEEKIIVVTPKTIEEPTPQPETPLKTPKKPLTLMELQAANMSPEELRELYPTRQNSPKRQPTRETEDTEKREDVDVSDVSKGQVSKLNKNLRTKE